MEKNSRKITRRAFLKGRPRWRHPDGCREAWCVRGGPARRLPRKT